MAILSTLKAYLPKWERTRNVEWTEEEKKVLPEYAEVVAGDYGDAVKIEIGGSQPHVVFLSVGMNASLTEGDIVKVEDLQVYELKRGDSTVLRVEKKGDSF